MCIIRTNAVIGGGNGIYERWVDGKTEKCNVFGKENVRLSGFILVDKKVKL